MDTLSYKTLSSNKISADKKWFVVDAEGQNLGRFSQQTDWKIKIQPSSAEILVKELDALAGQFGYKWTIGNVPTTR